MEEKDKRNQEFINDTFFGHLRIIDEKLKALSDYLNIHYYVDEKEHNVKIKERK